MFGQTKKLNESETPIGGSNLDPAVDAPPTKTAFETMLEKVAETKALSKETVDSSVEKVIQNLAEEKKNEYSELITKGLDIYYANEKKLKELEKPDVYPKESADLEGVNKEKGKYSEARRKEYKEVKEKFGKVKEALEAILSDQPDASKLEKVINGNKGDTK